MTLNVQDHGRNFWENSSCTDMHDPSSLASLPYRPGKSMCLETEFGSGRREHVYPVAAEPSPTVQSVDYHPQMADGPPTSAELSQVDLGEWYPRYLGCVQHFLDHAQHSVPVQSLAAFINIRLPCQRLSEPIMRFTGSSSGCVEHGQSITSSSSSSSYVSLRPYIRRLIVTAHDTPAVLEAFFGPEWLGGVGSICKQERVNYLFTAKSEGWAPTKAAYDILPDEHTPFLRPLREPAEEELRMAESRWSEWLAMEDWMVGPRSPW